MRKYASLVALLFFSCSAKEPYDVSRYYDVTEQYEVLTSIVTYIFDAPPYTKLEDRFKPDHRRYYASLTGKFSIKKYFIADNGTHYFYVVRPGPNASVKRGVGGHYRMNSQYQLTEFREEFVTPLLPESEITGRCAFLFDEMVKGDLKKYLGMATYVQWPNPASYYDTLIYQWKLTPEAVK